MAPEQGGGQAGRGDPEVLESVPLPPDPGKSESLTTVLVALAANVLIAAAKTAAGIVTGSASLIAEAAHSWADSGNEIFLLIANRRSSRPPDPAHPQGYGREAYVWSLFAALGLFVAGAVVSVAVSEEANMYLSLKMLRPLFSIAPMLKSDTATIMKMSRSYSRPNAVSSQRMARLSASMA